MIECKGDPRRPIIAHRTAHIRTMAECLRMDMLEAGVENSGDGD
jgi:hypothetical protein